MMPLERDTREFTDGLKSPYYQVESAQASSTTVPLVFRTSGSNIYSSSDPDDISSLNTADRDSVLYNDLLEEVRKPNMPPHAAHSRDSDALPSSLRVASYMKPSSAHVRSTSTNVIDESTESATLVSRGNVEGSNLVPKKGSRKASSSRHHDSSPRRESRQDNQQLDGQSPAGQILPTSTYQPTQPQNRATMDSNKYKPYRPSTSRKPSNAKNKSANSVSNKPLAAVALAGGAATGAGAAYLATDANDSFHSAQRAEVPDFSPTDGVPRITGGGMDSPRMGYNGQTSYPYPDSPASARGMDFGRSPKPVSPFDDRFSRAGFDNSTPGSPHDSPIEMSNSPIGSFMPGRDSITSDRNSMDGFDANADNNMNDSRSFEGNPPGKSPGAVSPTSSFGGSEFFPEENDYPRDDVLGTFSPSDDPITNRDLPLSPNGEFESPRDSFEGGTRSIGLSDAGPDYTDEKGASTEPADQKPLWKRPIVLIIAGVVALIIIIVIGVGIGLAVKNKNKSGGNDNNNNPTSNLDTNNNAQDTPVLGGFRSQDPAQVNDASVMTGTSMNTVTVSGSNRKRQNVNNVGGTNFFNFYQHSTGEIRMASWQNSNFQPSVLVVTDGHQGTPIAAYSRTDDLQISVFYFNKDKILQEARSQDGVTWQPGTIGKLGLTSDAPSDLTVELIESCGKSGLAWLVFHTGVNDQTKLIYWNEATDTWTESGGFPNVKQGAGFQGQSDGDAWRFYYVSSQNSQLSQMVCPECCDNSRAPSWKPGINGPPVTSATGGITVVTAGFPRIIYYQDADGTVRELNNTGKYPQEAYMMNVAPSRRGNLGVPAPNNAPVGPIGSAIGKVLPETKMGVAAGFRGSTAQLWLFTQINATGISLVIRNVDVVGQWTSPISIPVGR